MEWLFVIVPFLVVGIGVTFVAFSGGMSAAREAYMTGGGRLFTIALVLIYLGLGIAVPALVIANREEAKGAVGHLRNAELTSREERGKEIFIQTCKSCHDLDAVNARGVTGPDLDELGGLDRERVLNAIERGGTGTGRMPAGLLQDEDAEDVALYVSRVAGQ
jgi:mono/diheme cytochrome c family protein